MSLIQAASNTAYGRLSPQLSLNLTVPSAVMEVGSRIAVVRQKGLGKPVKGLYAGSDARGAIVEAETTGERIAIPWAGIRKSSLSILGPAFGRGCSLGRRSQGLPYWATPHPQPAGAVCSSPSEPALARLPADSPTGRSVPPATANHLPIAKLKAIATGFGILMPAQRVPAGRNNSTREGAGPASTRHGNTIRP